MSDQESKSDVINQSTPSGQQRPEGRAKDLGLALGLALNVAGLLAAPLMLAKALSEHEKKPVRQELCKVLDDAVTAFGPSASSTELVLLLCALRDRIATWEPGSPAPMHLVEAARNVLRALHVPEPEEGWDAWEGEPPESNRPAPPPEPRVLRPEPMSIDEWLAYEGPGELIDGLLVEQKAATPLQDAAAVWFLATLRAWALPRGGTVIGRGHKLAVASATGRKPDVCAYIPNGQAEEKGALTTPMLVLEVISANPLDARRARGRAFREYEKLGVPWYWMVDVSAQLFEAFELSSGNRYSLFHCANEGQLPQTGIEGLAIDLDDLWARLASAHRKEDSAPPF